MGCNEKRLFPISLSFRIIVKLNTTELYEYDIYIYLAHRIDRKRKKRVVLQQSYLLKKVYITTYKNIWSEVSLFPVNDIY